ncbi:MAG: toprim domain-containing protein, partial [Solirubrobacteraceae bacterium]
CFADPGAHAHDDRDPSCSVNLQSGAFNCHGCGAHGGAYDAALALGLAPRQAMDLLIANGLAQPRAHPSRRAHRTPATRTTTVMLAAGTRPTLTVADADVQAWAKTLDANSPLIRRLILERAWSPRITRALQIGSDGNRLTIPIRNAHGNLRGLLRYDAFGRREPKMRAAIGSRLGLIPHPASEASNHIILVEGPPDMISARSAGLAAIAVPGTNSWHPAWAELFASRRVTIVMDCDPTGRRAAHDIAASLNRMAAAVEVVDLRPDREDGYDLTDRILERRQMGRRGNDAARTVRSLLTPVPPTRHLSREPATSNQPIQHRRHCEK